MLPEVLLTRGSPQKSIWGAHAPLGRASKAEAGTEGYVRQRTRGPYHSTGLLKCFPYVWSIFFFFCNSYLPGTFQHDREIKGFWTGDLNLCPSLKDTWHWASPNFSQLQIPSLWVRMLDTWHSYNTGLQIDVENVLQAEMNFYMSDQLYRIVLNSISCCMWPLGFLYWKTPESKFCYWALGALACRSSWFLNFSLYDVFLLIWKHVIFLVQMW